MHLIKKLEKFTHLPSADKIALEQIGKFRVRELGAREDIIREGDRPHLVNLFLSGWGYRYKIIEDGRRQIISYFVPGDLCDLDVYILREMDHSISTLTPSIVAEISREALRNLMSNHPRITQALLWEALVSAAIQREWTVNLGKRTAFERLAHLLCELFLRLNAVGLTSGRSCEIPITQADLGDTVGLSTVHVNRTLQELRSTGLIVLKGKDLMIPDLEALKSAAMFNDNYLHLSREGSHLDAND